MTDLTGSFRLRLTESRRVTPSHCRRSIALLLLSRRTHFLYVCIGVGFLWQFCATYAVAQDSTATSKALQRIIDAKAAEDRGKWPVAIGLLTKIIAQSPNNGEFRLMLARARFKSGDYTTAVRDHMVALNLNADDPAALYYMVAKCYALQKNADLALDALKSFTALDYRNLDGAQVT